METRAEVRSVSRGVKRRHHRHVARLPLQLDGRISFDETCGRGSSAVHRHGGIHHQIAASNAHGQRRFTFSACCRSKRRSRDNRRNIERPRESVRNLSRRFCRGERRTSRISSLVIVVAMSLCRRAMPARRAGRAARLQLRNSLPEFRRCAIRDDAFSLGL